jgi:hypothetical protein
MGRLRRNIQIVGEAILLACGLGIAIDLITANVAVEYFTIHHPRLMESRSPFAMALLWGVGASWWFGAIAGSVLAIVNDRRPIPLSALAVRLMMFRACVVLWVTMMVTLGIVYWLIGFLPIRHDAAFEFNRRMMSVALTHLTENLLGSIAVGVVCIRLWKSPADERLFNGDA